MLLILLSWFYTIAVTFILGNGINNFFTFKNQGLLLQSLAGLFYTTLLAGFWAIFYRINWEFHCFLFALSFILGLVFKESVKESILNFKEAFLGLSKRSKIYFYFFLFILLLKSALQPTLFDNESYYIQTIKWLNEYGFVPGLANLNLFFGQTSGWHITQSVFNFSFFSNKLNDLNGYILLLGLLFSVLKLDNRNPDKNSLFLIILPLFSFFFIFFIDAPSPDLPVYIFTIIAFYLFITNYHQLTESGFILILVLVLFSVLIKPITVGLLLLPAILFLYHYNKLKQHLVKYSFLVFTTFLLMLIKSTIITGYPLYPLTFFKIDTIDFAVPDTVISYFFSARMRYSFFVPAASFDSFTSIQIIKNWFLFSKYEGIINLFSILSFIIAPFIFIKKATKNVFWILYSICFLEYILILFFSPHFRFFIQYSLIIIGLTGIILVKKEYIKLIINGSIIMIIAFFVLNSYNNSVLPNQNKVNLSSKTIIIPADVSSLNLNYDKTKIGNLEYYSPSKDSIFWITGNAKLPCVSENQIEYFKTNFKVIPQLRKTDLKNGFYSNYTDQNE